MDFSLENLTIEEARTGNMRLAKKRVQWLFVSSSVLADSLVLRNPLLRQAPNRYKPFKRTAYINKLDFNDIKLQ